MKMEQFLALIGLLVVMHISNIESRRITGPKYQHDVSIGGTSGKLRVHGELKMAINTYIDIGDHSVVDVEDDLLQAQNSHISLKPFARLWQKGNHYALSLGEKASISIDKQGSLGFSPGNPYSKAEAMITYMSSISIGRGAHATIGELCKLLARSKLEMGPKSLLDIGMWGDFSLYGGSSMILKNGAQFRAKSAAWFGITLADNSTLIMHEKSELYLANSGFTLKSRVKVTIGNQAHLIIGKGVGTCVVHKSITIPSNTKITIMEGKPIPTSLSHAMYCGI